MSRSKQLPTVALNNLNNIWITKDKIKQKQRIKLYKSLVKPIHTYNSSTWDFIKKEEESLDWFHRQQLRRILNIKYPAHISNAQVYKQRGEEMLSLEIFQNKLKLFRHVLRFWKLKTQEKLSWLTLVNDIYVAAKAVKNFKFFKAK